MMHPSRLQTAVTALCDVLSNDANPLIRLKAVEVLAKLGSEEAIPTLCNTWKYDPEFNLRIAAAEAISQIFNPQTPMSDAPKYDLRGANIGSFAETVQGDQISTQNIAATEANLDNILATIQPVIETLKQKYPVTTETEAIAIIDAEFQEIKQTQPWRWQNLLNLKRLWKGSKTAALKIGEHFAEENPWGKGIIGFLEGVSEEVEE
jgi:hypothetical protein